MLTLTNRMRNMENNNLDVFKNIFDVFETPLYYHIPRDRDHFELSLPGVGKDNISVSVEERNKLVVRWEKDGSKEERCYTLGLHKDISAEYIDGILKIKVTPDEAEKKTIEIK